MSFVVGGLGVWACRILSVSQQPGWGWTAVEWGGGRGKLAEASAGQYNAPQRYSQSSSGNVRMGHVEV